MEVAGDFQKVPGIFLTSVPAHLLMVGKSYTVVENGGKCYCTVHSQNDCFRLSTFNHPKLLVQEFLIIHSYCDI